MFTEQQVKNKLSEAYTKMKSDTHIQPNPDKTVSAPLCMYITNKWINSEERVLVVGQETLEWEFKKSGTYDWLCNDIINWSDFISYSESVEAMTYAYKDFCFSEHHPINHRAPFFRAYRQIRESVGDNPDGIETSVLWTNIFKMSLDGGSVVRNGTQDEICEIREASRNVLYSELEALQPTAVIFFTGPLYDDSLISLFPEVEFSPFCAYEKRNAATLSHKNLPTKSWRTCHPGYLQRSKQWGIIDSICEALES